MKPYTENKLLKHLHHIFSKFPEKTAFIFKEQEYTFGHLFSRSKEIYSYLVSQGVKKGEPILVNTCPHFETYAAMLAGYLGGFVLVPLSFTNSSERDRLILSNIPAKLVLTAEKTYDGIVNIDLHSISTSKLYSFPSLEDIDFFDPVLVLHTSGSTGLPKGACLSYANLWAYLMHFSNNFGSSFTHDHLFLQMFDLGFDFSLQHYLLGWITATPVLVVENYNLKFVEILRLLKKYPVTMSGFPPSFLRFCRPFVNREAFSSVKYAVFSSEALLIDDLQVAKKLFPAARMDNQYGPTECTVTVTSYNHLEKINQPAEYQNIISIGRPYQNNVIYIVDENLKPLANGEKGEIVIAGPQVATYGYLNSSASENKFVKMKTEGGGVVDAYRTGDSGYFNEERLLMYTGRIDFQIKMNGYRIEPAELEGMFRKHYPGINVVVVKHTRSNLGDCLAFVIENVEPQYINSIKENLLNIVPRHFQPIEVYAISQFPLNANGKTDRSEIQRLLNLKSNE